MKQILLTCLLTVLTLTLSAQTQQDMTNYISNPSFENGTDGWTISGLSSQSNSSFTKKKGAYYIEKWVSSNSSAGSASAKQKLSGLPMGVYKLTAGAQNLSQNDESKQCKGANIVAGSNKTPVYTPADYSVEFSYTAGEVEIGFVASGAEGNWLAVDNFRLYRIGDVSVDDAKAALQTLIKSAETSYGAGTARGAAALRMVIDAAKALCDDENATAAQVAEAYTQLTEAVATFKALGTADTKLKNLLTTAQTAADKAQGNEADELKQAIAAARAVYDNAEATVDQLTEVTTALQQALDDYNYGHPTGNIPTVKTGSRYLRGATMAFGRLTITNNGATIKERGFCWAETPEPTIFDNRSSKTLTSSNTDDFSGTVYWLKDLKPATKYYMRAYAITSGYQVAYGDVIKFYTIPKGTISLTVRDGGDAATYNRIKSASESAVYYWNNLTEMKGFSPSVGYESGTGTADCSYGGWVRVGPNTSYQRTGTILHEFLHGIGVIPYADTEWARFTLRSSKKYWERAGKDCGTGSWLGERAAEVVRFFKNDNTSMLSGDCEHMWPYGINGAHEDSGEEILYIANGLTCQALGEDGLQHTSSLFAEPYYALDQEDDVKYYIKNESADRGLYTSYLKPTAAGVLKWVVMSTAEAAQNDSVAWYITFTPQNQYYQFRNAATGQYMTYNNGIKTATKTTLSSNEDWHLMKGRVDIDGQRGYWIIHSESNWTPKCLQANANGATAVATFNIANSAETQRWLISTIEGMQAAETTAIAQMKKQTEDVLKQVKALAAVPHAEDVAGADNALATSISDIEARLAAATSTSELASLAGEAETAGITFLSGVTPTGTPFDLTYKLANPTIDNNSDGWNGEPTINYGCGEFYQATFDFNQTVTNLPAGTYVFSAQGFQRPGSYSSAANVAVNATIYAGAKSQKLLHIKDGSQSKKVGMGREQTMNSKYIPDDMQAAAAYFKKGYYENRVIGSVATQGSSLKVGIKSTSMPSNYWAIFDTFHLYFYGSKTAEDVTAVKGVVESRMDGNRQVFDLQGRRVNTPTKGLYIINGRKVFIK